MKEFFANIDAGTIFEVAKYIAILIFGAATAYYRTNAKLQKFVAGLITQAETAYSGVKTGGVKFEWVCNKIYSMIPAPLKLIVTRQMIEEIVQGTFNSMAAYAKTQLNKLVDTAIPDTVHTEDK